MVTVYGYALPSVRMRHYSSRKGEHTMVYVLAKDHSPLMPTENHAKVRVLLKTGRAKVVRREPFVIQG